MEEFNIFKIEYNWYEGEHEDMLIGKKVNINQFEKDLAKAKRFARGLCGKKCEGDYLGKGYSVECLPQFYEQILWYLTYKLGYIYCYYDNDISYSIDDTHKKKILAIRYQNKTEKKEIN